MIYLPFLGAISLAAGTILEKIVVKRKNIDIKFYQTAIFFVIMLVMLPFIYFYWKFDPQALQPLHIIRHHLKFNKYFLSAILGSFFFALELVISRLILDYYSSLTFYFLRCAFIFLFSLIIFRPKMIQMDKTLTSYIFITGIFWVLYRVIIYYGYVNLGIIFTTLIIMVSPIFIYLFAHIFLKENLSWRNIIASIIIIGCVLYATIF